MDNLSVEMLAAAILAILLEFFPILRVYWGKLSKNKKLYITALLNALLALSVVLFDCYGGSGVCPESWLNSFFMVLTPILVINQAAYTFIAKPNSPRKQ